MYVRDYKNKGVPLIDLGGNIGTVNATTQNFNLSAEEITQNKAFQKLHRANSRIYCLVPWELDIPF